MEFEQKTLGWRIDRLGRWNASEIGNLQKGQLRTGEFSDTAISYIMKVAAERSFNQKLVENEDAMQAYFDSVELNTKAIQWGVDNEPNARNLFAKIKNIEVIEVGSFEHPTIPFISASPDGEGNEKRSKFGIEIKCPSIQVYMKYLAMFGAYGKHKLSDEMADIKTSVDDYMVEKIELTKKLEVKSTKTGENRLEWLLSKIKESNEALERLSEMMHNKDKYNANMLLEINPMYYDQIQTQIDVRKYKYVYFILYHPMLANPIQIIKIMPDNNRIKLIHDNVEKAEGIIKMINN
jgi:hypothetical protein